MRGAEEDEEFFTRGGVFIDNPLPTGKRYEDRTVSLRR
jgi:hypothetical protein